MNHAAGPEGVGKDLWLFGAGGHAKVVISTARAAGWRVVGLVAGAAVEPGSEIAGVRVHTSRSGMPAQMPCHVAIGSARIRQRVVEEAGPVNWLTLVHPRAYVAEDVVLGAGTAVLAMAVVQPGSRVGRHVIVNTAAVVEHDNQLGDYVQVATGASLTGGVQVGTGSFIGAGAVVLPGVRIGEWCIVAAGAVVTRDVPDGETVIGVPARVRRQ